MSASGLIWADDWDAALAWRDGRAISRRQYLADVHRLAQRLPAQGPVLNLTGDRYRFAVGLGAALLRGQCNLLPPNHTRDTIARLQRLYPHTYGLTDLERVDAELELVHHQADSAAAGTATANPSIADAALAAQVLTSGSTGAPAPHSKTWGLLVRNTRSGARRLASEMGRANLAGVTLVATVPAQHMYGFESTVLIAMLAGAAFDTDRPFYAADIAAALARAPTPRMLVTTPFHLKMLLEAQIALPPIDLTVCATAPLAPQLAARAEAALGAPLMEIYGCTEAGQVATRRTTRGAEWQTYDDLTLSGNADRTTVQGGHVPQPTALADVLDVVDAQSFRLLGRSNDLINIAGKRSSLGHLNYHLNSIAGILDGAFWLPPAAADTVVTRLVAFVVAPAVTADALHERVVTALRRCVDPAFLPRRVIAVTALPRAAGTGKLPVADFDAWARQQLAQTAAPPAARGA